MSPNIHGPVIAGTTVLALVFGGFGTWSYLAPLASAAVAQGEVRVETHRKAVQHLEGGIIRELLVHNDEIVHQGQVVARLDAISAGADRDMLTAQKSALMAARTRLIAERDHAPLSFPSGSTASDIASQQAIFDSRQHSIETETDIYGEKIQQMQAESEGYKAQVEALDQQAVYLREQIKAQEYLNARGLQEKPKLLETQRTLAVAMGSRAQNVAEIAKVAQQIGEAKINIIKLHTDEDKEVAKDLRDTEEKLSDATEKLRKASDVFGRTDIVATQDGKVVNLKQFTIGGVLKPGDVLLEIVPQNDVMLVECRVDPKDISAVQAGLSASVRLPSYKQRRTPTLEARVLNVAADIQTDEKQTPKSFYLAEVEIAADQLAAVPDVHLYQGMPAEVMIEISKRTAFEYFIEPIRESFHRSLHER